MHMEKSETSASTFDDSINDIDEMEMDDEMMDEDEIDVGSPVRTDSDLGLGTSENSGHSSDPNSDDGHSDH